MDALLEARTQVTSALEGWLHDGKPLLKAAAELGVDTARFTEAFGTPARTLTGRTSGTRSRIRRPAARRGGGSNGNGQSVTAEQVLDAVKQQPMNASDLSKHFGVTRQTITRRLTELAGRIERNGNEYAPTNVGEASG